MISLKIGSYKTAYHSKPFFIFLKLRDFKKNNISQTENKINFYPQQ